MRAMVDSLVNFVSQMATGKSKLASDEFMLLERSLLELSNMYRGDWAARKIIDAPIADMLREWREWHAKPAQVAAIEDAEDRHDVITKLARATAMGRLYGGAVIVIGADVANPMRPLTPRTVGRGGLKYLTVLSRFEIATPEIERDPRSPMFGKPLYYEINASQGGSVRVHPSRVIRFLGNDRLDSALQTDGWSDSALLSIYDAIHNRALAETGIAELIHEAKVDVIRIPNLGNALSTPDGTRMLTTRFTNAAALKSINNMLLLDNQEEWDRKQTSFNGLPEILDRYLQIVAAASDIPATRLLGVTAKGLNNSGAGDLTNYYDMLAGLRARTVAPQLAYLDQILWVDATGSVPADAYAEWRPMWQMTPKEKADIAKAKAETTKIYAEMGVLDEGTLRQGVQNQLVEDSVYPGLEAAIAALQSRIASEGEEPAAENDNPPADRSLGDDRNGLARFPYAVGAGNF